MLGLFASFHILNLAAIASGAMAKFVLTAGLPPRRPAAPAPSAAAAREAALPPSAAPPEREGEPPARERLSLTVDVVMREVTVEGQPVELTPKEFDLLSLFAQNPGRPFTRDELLDRIWQSDYEVTDRTIDTHVQRLRRKLGAQAAAIETVWGVGYRLRLPRDGEEGDGG